MHVPLTLADFLYRAEMVYGGRSAIVDEPNPPGGGLGRTTYGELAAMARSLASALDERDVPEGARVAIISPNSTRFLATLFGVSAFGRVLVPVNYRLNATEIGFILGHSGSTVVLMDPEVAGGLAHLPMRHRLVLERDTDADLFFRKGAAPRFAPRDEAQTASINYTSGTTARPKGVQLSHRSCYMNAVTLALHASVTDRDVYLHTLPTFHANGWGMPYALTALGAKQVIQRKVDGAELLRRVQAEGVTLMCAAPAVLAAALDAATLLRERGEAIPGSGKMRVVVAGAPPPSKTIERIETELGWEFIQIYGLTEASPLLTVNRAPAEWDHLEPAERARLLSRAGVPAVGVRMDVSPSGEILARSNHVFDGYYEQPEETSKAIVDGWLHTGDGGHLEGAYTVVTDRKKDVIITGGENVSSIEVEDCLYQHAAVAEAAVIGIPHDKWGETVLAFIVKRPGTALDVEGAIAHCRSHLAHYKCPTVVEFRDALPRTATGKLQKFKLREPYWANRAKQVS
jgi:fatty-acyl-CoA synthase